jgi:hypothetical protein
MSPSHAVDHLGAAAGGKASTAVQQLEADLQRAAKAADRTAEEMRALDTSVQVKKLESSLRSTSEAATQTSAAAKSGGESLGLLGSFAGKAAGMLGPGLLAGAAYLAGGALRDMAAATLATDTALANMPFGIERAREATGGLVSDSQLAKSAAQGLALGVIKTEGEFVRLSEAATKLGIKLGIGPTQALDNMMTALGRGSTEILDNLGVALKASEAHDRYAKSIGTTADKLTDAQKKEAFQVEAIKALTAAADGTVVKMDSAAAAIERFSTKLDNAKSSASGFLVEVAGNVVIAGEKMADALATDAEEVKLLQEQADEFRKLANAERARTAAQLEYLAGVGKETVQLTEEEAAAYKAAGDAAFEQGKSLGTLRLTDYFAQAKDLTGALLDQAEAHLKAARGADAQSESEKALFEKLAQRNAAAEDKAIEEAFFAANAMGPALPPGYKPPEKKGKGKKREDLSASPNSRAVDYGASVGATIDLSLAAEYKREIEAFEKVSATRAAAIKQMDAQIQVADARAERERTNVDMILFTVDVETEAQRARERLLEEQIRKEEQLARWEVRNAKTKEQRERAQTRLEEVEGKKRANAMQREIAAEERAYRKRQEVVERVSGAVMTLGEGMVDAFERMAQGERGAIASMLSELLKGVAKKHAILALGEAALAVGAAASYRYAAAAQHGTAAARIACFFATP